MHKKDLQAVEQKRYAVLHARHVWITRRQPFMRNLSPRIGFIDESSLRTSMAKTIGWSAKGARLIDHASFGHWNTQTFIAAPRHNRLDAPWVSEGAMNREFFGLYVETQLVPTLQPGEVIILDTLSSQNSSKAAEAMRAIGAWFRCSRKRPTGALSDPSSLPPFSPVKLAFEKLKAPRRRATARTYHDLWQAVGHVRSLFTKAKCYNFFKAA